MNCKMISGCESQFNICSQSTYQPRNLSSLGSCSSVSFENKLNIPSLIVKSAASDSFRIMARASTMDTYCTQAQTTESFYDLLGISETVTSPEIKKAYKQLARKYHPDVSPPDRIDEHTRMFIMVKEAYDTLSDPDMKSMYDRDLAGESHPTFSERGEWKSKWESQLNEIKRRTMNKNHRGKTSWGARMRKQRD